MSPPNEPRRAGTRPLRLLGELPEPKERPALAIAAKGFRPFFLLAALFAAAFMPVWVLVFRGAMRLQTALDPVTWHAHELIFGFAVAVIAGFLLTAVGNWTQRETLTGMPLLALAALWVAGRVAMAWSGPIPPLVVAVVDLSFLPLLGLALGGPLFATNNRRNFIMLAILGALFLSNVFVHAEAIGLAPSGIARRACLVAVDLVVLVIFVIAGRVFPLFTRNATSVPSIRNLPALDIASILGMATFTLLDAFAPDSTMAAVAASSAAVLSVARAIHWGALHSFRKPLLWILHLGYAWIPLGLLLRAVSIVTPYVSRSTAVHALTAGAIGSLTLGMMARVALGHSGRPLEVSKPIVAAFLAVVGAGIVRVIVPLAVPGAYLGAITAAAALWTLGFTLYAAVYAPIVATPRVDGKAG